MTIFRAYVEYRTAFQAGDDGRPDWMARKACNYMTEAVEVFIDYVMKATNVLFTRFAVTSWLETAMRRML